MSALITREEPLTLPLPPSPQLEEFLSYLGELGFSDLYTRPAPSRSKSSLAPASSSPTATPTSARPSRPAASERPAAAKPRPAPGAGTETPAARRLAPEELTMPLSAMERSRRLELLRQEAAGCRQCRLASGRQTVVFGDGFADADLMFVGEGPGAEEDARGLPFVGAAGELLTKIIKAIQLDRSQVYIANIVKCRPPGNRDPEHVEISACLPFLERQIALVRPRLIVCLGRVAACTLLETTSTLSQLRGKVFAWHGIELRVTYHPAALLRDPSWKRPVWEDMQQVRDRLAELIAQGPKP